MGTFNIQKLFAAPRIIRIFLSVLVVIVPASAIGQVALLDLVPDAIDPGIEIVKNDKNVRVVSNHCLYSGDLVLNGRKDNATASFRLDKKYSFLQCRVLGCLAVWNQNDERMGYQEFALTKKSSAYVIEGDGKSLSSGSVDTLGSPRNLVIDVSGVDVLKIHLSDSACLQNPQLTKFGITQTDRAKPSQPKDDATVREDHIRFEWAPSGAKSSYYIVITASNVAEEQAKAQCWAFPVGQVTSFDVDAKTLPDGAYVWQVISLGMLGKGAECSPSSGFTLARHNATAIRQLPDLTAQSRVVPFGDHFLYPDVLGCLTNETSFFNVRKFLLNDSQPYHYLCAEVPADADRLVLKIRQATASAIVGDLLVDGELYKKISVSKDHDSVMTIPVADVHTVAISLDQRDVINLFGTFYSVPAPQLIAPEDGVTIKTETDILRWAAVDGADHYVVRMIPNSILVPPTPDSVKIFDVGSDPQLLLNVKNWPAGWYEWQVQAFDGKQVLGKWSLSFQLKIMKN